MTLKCECRDRFFLNGYVKKVQRPEDLAYFLTQVRGEEIPRYDVVGKMMRDFIAAVEGRIHEKGIPVVHFKKGQRTEDIAEPYFDGGRA